MRKVFVIRRISLISAYFLAVEIQARAPNNVPVRYVVLYSHHQSIRRLQMESNIVSHTSMTLRRCCQNVKSPCLPGKVSSSHSVCPHCLCAIVRWNSPCVIWRSLINYYECYYVLGTAKKHRGSATDRILPCYACCVQTIASVLLS